MFAAFADLSCNLRPQKLKYAHVIISCLDGNPRKFIREKLQDDQTSKILYLENFPIYGILSELLRLLLIFFKNCSNYTCPVEGGARILEARIWEV